MTDIEHVSQLRWPQDASKIALLGLEAKQMWYLSIDSRDMIFIANTQEFKRFWNKTYVWPVKLKRFALRLRRMLFNG